MNRAENIAYLNSLMRVLNTMIYQKIILSMENFKIHPVLQNSHLHLWLLFFYIQLNWFLCLIDPHLEFKQFFQLTVQLNTYLDLVKDEFAFGCTILFFLVFHDYLYVKSLFLFQVLTLKWLGFQKSIKAKTNKSFPNL